MLLVKCKPKNDTNTDDYYYSPWGSEVRLVVATIGTEYVVDCSEDILTFPHHYDADNLTHVYGSIPATWFSSSNDDPEWKSTSFPEWVNDKHFYEKLIDDYDKEASKQAWNIYNGYVDSQLIEFAIDNFGSVEKAQEIVTKAKREKLIADYRARGFEIPEEREELESLTFDNMYRAYEKLNEKLK